MSKSEFEKQFFYRTVQLLKSQAAVHPKQLPVPEFYFDETRRRLDFAYPLCQVAVELHGATATGGKYTRPRGIEDALNKANDLSVAGWTLFTFSTLSDLDASVQRVLAHVQASSDLFTQLEQAARYMHCGEGRKQRLYRFELPSLLQAQALVRPWRLELGLSADDKARCIQCALRWCMDEPYTAELRGRDYEYAFERRDEYLHALEYANTIWSALKQNAAL
jgi:hypothetical protein